MKDRAGVEIALWLGWPILFAGFLAVLVLARDMAPAVQSAVLLGIVLGAMALGVVGRVRRQGRLDEMEIAAMRFGALWGPVAVSVLIAAIAFLPAAQSVLADLGSRLDNPGRGGLPAYAAMFCLGAAAALFAQMTAAKALSAAWTWSRR